MEEDGQAITQVDGKLLCTNYKKFTPNESI